MGRQGAEDRLENPFQSAETGRNSGLSDGADRKVTVAHGGEPFTLAGNAVASAEYLANFECMEGGALHD